VLHRLNLWRIYLSATLYLLSPIALGLAGVTRTWLGQHWLVGQLVPSEYIHLSVLVTLVWIAAVHQYRVASLEELFLIRTGLRSIIAASAATHLIVFSILFFYRGVAFSRVFLVISATILTLLTVLARTAFRHLVREHVGPRHPIRVLVVGADKFAQDSASRLESGSCPPCRVVAHICLPDQDIATGERPLYKFNELPEGPKLRELVDEVVIAVRPERLSDVPGIATQFEQLFLPVRAVVDLGSGFVIREAPFRLGLLHVFNLDVTPVDQIHYMLLKRVFDVAFSSLALILLSPLLLVIAMGVKVSSPGPVLFVQERVGLNGKVFRMLKFRTMRVFSKAESNTRWTTAMDPYRTRFGAFLRRASLDELPQFFNVLKGEMSVVGPRPERPHFVAKFLGEVSKYNTRHRLKVGITGWAQVNGLRGDTSITTRVQYDLYYMLNWSFKFDIRIIWLTLRTVAFGKNAY